MHLAESAHSHATKWVASDEREIQAITAMQSNGWPTMCESTHPRTCIRNSRNETCTPMRYKCQLLTHMPVRRRDSTAVARHEVQAPPPLSPLRVWTSNANLFPQVFFCLHWLPIQYNRKRGGGGETVNTRVGMHTTQRKDNRPEPAWAGRHTATREGATNVARRGQTPRKQVSTTCT